MTIAALLSLAPWALFAGVSGALAGFNPLHHSGPASPYFDAPAQFGILSTTPVQCSVDQAAYLVRHGSRFPEPGSFAGWQSLFAKLQNATYNAKGPLSFLPSWTPPIDDIPHDPLFLSSTGSREAFDLGVELRKRYRLTRGGDNFTVWSAGQQRVVDTATYFTLGYLSQGNYISAPGENRGHVITMPDSVNYTFADSLTPSAGCPAYSSGDTSFKATTFRGTYQSTIANRLNKYLDGLTLNATDIGVMQDLCGFQAEVNGDTRFCDIFTESEWLDYEYAHDLNYYYGSGPGNPFSATTGYPWVKAITELFVTGPNDATESSGSNFVPPPLIMSFTHDNNLPPAVSALGLWNTSELSGVYPLSAKSPNRRRTFRSSYLVSFRGYVALERLSCDEHDPPTSVKHIANQPILGPGASVNAQKYVRIRINNAVVPVPGCASGPGSSCPLASFAAYIKKRAAVAGDFVKTCGLQDVKNATNTLDIFTTFPSDAAQTSMLLVPLPYASAP
ncbi:phosphoglycerate mutase-like protein [Lentinus tigrinus ALCF2SS1-7]|uniref:Phosphoglycerate mutase-like protein n=1 Tax=Lentinus tigrinus ALCF2SS1-6 TaxID=1328759 RepID=A0A5C2SQ06_9APHY|nr:phosphoglycerate mutase-like protein [Lentinus tigrinus ALCF2SS1-6]RPD79173.1 phosphoglycerate mutase-like protein [Lentinus tigrinus ALCF2SS1-7]